MPGVQDAGEDVDNVLALFTLTTLGTVASRLAGNHDSVDVPSRAGHLYCFLGLLCGTAAGT